MVNTFLVLLKPGSWKKGTINLVLTFIIYAVYLNAERLDIFQPMYVRILNTLGWVQYGNIELIANRSWSEAAPIVVKKASLLGHGAFLSGYFYDHIMIPHCLYFDMYSKFGLFGICALVFLFVKIFKMSYRIGNKEFIFFSTVIALAVQQIKISAFRSVSSMLLYTFLFTAIYVLYTRSRDGKICFKTLSDIKDND